ncbi:LysR family transcriptional regulator [Rhodophyticola sp. CCM32]|uniref:LysR substrate-binding domain-containing protein n=1 Tax=Rhodophyticola sp. CCM32 TaxID=2916397 RepID=UPI00107F516D|nr:LysR substrate-binding domain-containing protein [Rhodophyticola sp. CCM32]QBY02546.1 LysR family transcriptional regulator [Rhodophyticola sp. CCM32]
MRTISLDMARTFAAICDTGSFRLAASRVNRSPSAVSLQVGKLEELLQCELLLRDARKVTLTEAGEQFLGSARRLLSLNDEMLSKFRGSTLSGHLRLAAPHDLGMSTIPALLRRFAVTHPNICVDVRLDACDDAQALFASGDAQVVFFSERNSKIHAARKLYTEELCWLQAAGGVAAQNTPLPIAVSEKGCSWRDAALAALDRDGIPYRVAYSSDTSPGQLAAVRADLAVAALPKTIVGKDVSLVSPKLGLPNIGSVTMFMAHDDSKNAAAFSAHVDAHLAEFPHHLS